MCVGEPASAYFGKLSVMLRRGRREKIVHELHELTRIRIKEAWNEKGERESERGDKK